MSNIATLSAQLANRSRELAEARRQLEAVKDDDSISDELYMTLEDAVYDLEDEITYLEEQIEAEEANDREGRHGWQ